jgi:hypothetical protein
MVKLAWCLVVVAIVGVAIALAAQPAAAQGQGQTQMDQQAQPAAQPRAAGEYPNVGGLRQFAAESNYMSLPGYLRWQVFMEQKVWLSVPEAKRIVTEQSGK